MSRFEDIVKTAGHVVGVEISRYRPRARRRAALMDRHGIDLVIDVGAYVGGYGGTLREHGYAGSIVSFEPLAEVFPALEARTRAHPPWTCHNVALGAAAGTATMTRTANLVSSSLRDIQQAHVAALPESAPVGRERVEVVRLADVTLPPAHAALLKLDVQGVEDDVLAGAGDALGLVALLEIELSLVELYAGQRLLPEMLTLLRGHGFALVALEPGFRDRRSGAVLQFDGVFTRSSTSARAS